MDNIIENSVLERKTIETIICYDCPIQKVPSPGELGFVKGILKQEVKSAINPTTIEYLCSMGNDDCRELKNYESLQNFYRRFSDVEEIIKSNLVEKE